VDLVAVDWVAATKMGIDPMISPYMKQAVKAFGFSTVARLYADGEPGTRTSARRQLHRGGSHRVCAKGVGCHPAGGSAPLDCRRGSREDPKAVASSEIIYVAVSLRMYNEAHYAVRVEEPLASGGQHSPLWHHVSGIVDATLPPWRSFAETVERTVSERAAELRALRGRRFRLR